MKYCLVSKYYQKYCKNYNINMDFHGIYQNNIPDWIVLRYCHIEAFNIHIFNLVHLPTTSSSTLYFFKPCSLICIHLKINLCVDVGYMYMPFFR